MAHCSGATTVVSPFKRWSLCGFRFALGQSYEDDVVIDMHGRGMPIQHILHCTLRVLSRRGTEALVSLTEIPSQKCRRDEFSMQPLRLQAHQFAGEAAIWCESIRIPPYVRFAPGFVPPSSSRDCGANLFFVIDPCFSSPINNMHPVSDQMSHVRPTDAKRKDGLQQRGRRRAPAVLLRPGVASRNLQ